MTSRSQSQNKSAQTKSGDEIPIVDIYAPEPDDPATKELQRNRGKKYDTGVPLEDFLEPYSDLLDLPLSHASVEPALPIGQSDMVAVGTITGSKAFLSSDRTNVYSEFTFKIEETLRNSSPVTLDANSIITTERVGGKVRFPSGNILLRGISGRNLPEKGHRYVLFLKWNESGKDFVILTGYKLQNGVVTPLDGEKSPNSIYRNYAQYAGKRDSELIKAIKNALKDSSQEVKE